MDFITLVLKEVLRVAESYQVDAARMNDDYATLVGKDVVDNIQEMIYRKKLREYRIEDAKNHAEDMDLVISDETAGELVDMYDKCQDCNIAENDLWEQIINDYIMKGEK